MKKNIIFIGLTVFCLISSPTANAQATSNNYIAKYKTLTNWFKMEVFLHLASSNAKNPYSLYSDVTSTENKQIIHGTSSSTLCMPLSANNELAEKSILTQLKYKVYSDSACSVLSSEGSYTGLTINHKNIVKNSFIPYALYEGNLKNTTPSFKVKRGASLSLPLQNNVLNRSYTCSSLSIAEQNEAAYALSIMQNICQNSNNPFLETFTVSTYFSFNSLVIDDSRIEVQNGCSELDAESSCSLMVKHLESSTPLVAGELTTLSGDVSLKNRLYSNLQIFDFMVQSEKFSITFQLTH